MRKLIICSVFGVLLLTGCSFQIGNPSPETEEFARQADALDEKITETISELRSLGKKDKLSEEDQQLIVEEIEVVLEHIKEFKREDTTVLEKMTQKVVKRELNKLENALLDIQEQASTGEIKAEDIEEVLGELSYNIQLSL